MHRAERPSEGGDQGFESLRARQVRRELASALEASFLSIPSPAIDDLVDILYVPSDANLGTFRS
jgi:hypothetical protein